jgi:hypothetical protein
VKDGYLHEGEGSLKVLKPIEGTLIPDDPVSPAPLGPASWRASINKLLLVLIALILLVFLVAVIRETNGVAPQSTGPNSSQAGDGTTEYPAGTSLVVGIGGHPNMYMWKDNKTIIAMAHAENATEMMAIVARSLAAGGGRLIPYGTKAALALPAKPNAEWIIVRITDGVYAGETGFLLGPGRDGSPAQFHYANN